MNRREHLGTILGAIVGLFGIKIPKKKDIVYGQYTSCPPTLANGTLRVVIATDQLTLSNGQRAFIEIPKHPNCRCYNLADLTTREQIS